jgi:UPF0755 protein
MKVLLRAAVALLVLGLGGLGAGWYVLDARTRAPYRGHDEPERFIEIESGMSPRAITAALVDQGIVRDPLTFRFALWRSGQERRLQAGEYRFADALSARDVIDRLARGDVYLLHITFPEGLTVAEMSLVFEAGGFGAASQFVDAAKDASLIRAIDPDARDLEGYLFPDTYAVPRRTTAERFVRVMVDRFLEVLTSDLRRAAETRGLSVRQLVTLASLVEKETAVASERPVVAGVYTNRLRIGMPLQCDPTVIYALVRAGQYDGNLRRVDLEFDSPYNTYRYRGLPPGPIAAPGRDALLAAATPADVEYLYFVSRNDGSHAFARTFPEHNRNVQQYQVQYFRQRR